MVVEHTFVTTLPPTQAMGLAADFLTARGFKPDEGPRAFAVAVVGGAGDAVPAVWDTLQARRGRPPLAARKARHLRQLPQSVRLEWDRGRVVVAASITDRFKKTDRAALLTAIATGLERLLAQQQSPELAGTEWDAVERRLDRAQRRSRIVGIVVVAVVILIFASVIWLARRAAL